MKPPNVTDRQAEVLSLVAEFIDHDYLGRGPTFLEIAAVLTVQVSTAHGHVTSLIEHGCIRGTPNIARSLEVTPIGRNVVERWRESVGWAPKVDPRPDPRGGNVPYLTAPKTGT